MSCPTQTHRAAGDPVIMADIASTITLFKRFFRDKTERGGYDSHIDPIMLGRYSEAPGRNRTQ